MRSIISADDVKAVGTETVRYNLKQHKVFIFSKETEERIYFGEQMEMHNKLTELLSAELTSNSSENEKEKQ